MSLDKDRELLEAQAEVKALKLSERLKTKAVEEVRSPCVPCHGFIMCVALA
jgi:hypothetical protein